MHEIRKRFDGTLIWGEDLTEMTAGPTPDPESLPGEPETPP